MYYSIGEFSKLAKLSIATLRYYDSIGILKPEKRKENSRYRYYATEQLMKAQLIHDLRKAGVSLDEIKIMLEHNDVEKIVSSLEMLRKRIEERSLIVKSLCDYYSEGLRAMELGYEDNDDIYISEMPAMDYISYRKRFIFNDFDDFISQCFKLQEIRDENGLIRCGSLMAVCRDGKIPPPKDDTGEYDIELIMRVYAGMDSDRSCIKHVEKQKIVTVVTTGNLDDATESCNHIVQWIEQSVYVQAGDPIIEYVLEPCDIMSYTDFPVKIHIPIKRECD